MQIGVITVGGRQVGVVSLTDGYSADPFVPDLDGYVPQGRAAEHTLGAPSGAAHAPHRYASHGHEAHTSDRAHHHTAHEGYTPQGKDYAGSGSRPVSQGSAEVDQAIVEAARAHHLDPNTMRAIADIESGMNPSSNANRSTQYKGLYQIGHDEWRRFGGGGNIYSARENAMGAARMFEANRNQFREHFHRDPTDAELYMMHQQGLGFYTRGAMTNISGNPYPGMHGAQTHESFEEGWGRRLARGKAAFAARHGDEAKAEKPFDPETSVP
ncbi:transglycosylase SLT domain-containing protein [Bradyrhizobium sp. Tv2a-2]|uniref:transglycosylase SLT domain-containing protein n=1 Tax=Bradyrhizobium sp. Tv2a-2 TaxID=113395 RepID=UPI00041EB2A3|nr:transglycosylase SLT domain-containing protein [Bradyrhizobium sp. Tv2a-2]